MNRKRISIILAVVMILALLPMTASAASENRVTRVVSSAEEQMLSLGDTYLVIQDQMGDLGDDTQNVRLNLENAEWAPTGEWFVDTFRFYNEGSFVAGGNDDALEINRVSSTRIDLTFSLDADHFGGSDVDEIRIPILAEVQEQGEANIVLDNLNSAVTGGTYQFANVVDADVIINIEEVISFGPGETGILGKLIIDETTPGSLDLSEEIQMTLPSGFEWAENQTFTVTGSAGLRNEVDVDQDDVGAGTRDLAFTLEDIGIERGAADRHGTIVMEGLAITSDTRNFGDVNIVFGGVLERFVLEGATFIDYDVSVEIDDDPAQIVSGRLDTAVEGGFSLPALLMEERVFDSWVPGRSVTVAFEDWIKIVEVDGVETEDFTPGDSEFTFTPQRDGQERMEFEINLDVTVRADAEGNIRANVTSRGLEEDYTVLMGEAIAPIRIGAEAVEILVGSRENPMEDIYIEENVARALREGMLEIELERGEWLEGLEVIVDSGDIEIGDVEIDENLLIIEIERESIAPSTLLITGAIVEMPLQAPVGTFDIRFGGSSLVDNNIEDYFEDHDFVAELPLLQAVLERTADTVTFTVGQNYYMVGDEMIEMDTAPYISADRLMVPVAYVSRGLGIDRDDVVWDGEARTVTILEPTGETLQMTIGSQILLVGEEEMDMGAMAEITDDRTFVPISRFARALDIEYTWDPETETVEFQP